MGVGLSIILLLIATILFWLLFAPIQLIVDTRKGQLSILWKRVAHASVSIEADDILLQIKLLFWTKKISLLEKKKKKETSEKRKQKTRKKRSYTFRQVSAKIKRVVQSFELKKLILNIDTDDYLLNAKLFPLFGLLTNGKERRLRVNYQEEFEFILIIENRLIRLLRAIIF